MAEHDKPSENAASEGPDPGLAGAVVEAAGEHPAGPAPAALPVTALHQGAAWGDGLARFQKRWADLETQIAIGVLLAETLSLCSWILLKGLSTPPTSSKGGIVLRAVLTSIALGSLVWVLLRRQPERLRSTATTIAAAAGLFLGRTWAGVGVTYTSEMLNWYQDASSLTLIGGLRGVGTRLTAWLAMLGASLATSSGKHINVDVVMRFVPVRARVPAAVVAWLAASLVCFTAMWGFVDYIALANFDAPKDGSPGAKIAAMGHEGREHGFLLRRQMGLDWTVGFRVLAGQKYTESLSGAEWNQKIREGGYEQWYTPEQIKALYVPDGTAYVAPIIVVPAKTPRNLLVDDLNLLFPLGFFMIGLKFILRALLAISGHVVVDPDAMHKEEGMEPVVVPPEALAGESGKGAA